MTREQASPVGYVVLSIFIDTPTKRACSHGVDCDVKLNGGFYTLDQAVGEGGVLTTLGTRRRFP